MFKVWPTRSIRLLFAALALLILTYGTLQPVTGIAQSAGASRATQNAWIKLCFDAPKERPDKNGGSSQPPAASETVEACYTYVDIREQRYGFLMGKIGVLQSRALDRTLLIALLPMDEGVYRQPGYLDFQDGSRIKLEYLPSNPCNAGGCYGRAELSQDLLDRIMAARALSFGNEDISGRWLSSELACCGFTETFEGAPVPATAYDERRKTMEIVKLTFADFIQ